MNRKLLMYSISTEDFLQFEGHNNVNIKGSVVDGQLF
jgi:hypothetical protein